MAEIFLTEQADADIDEILRYTASFPSPGVRQGGAEGWRRVRLGVEEYRVPGGGVGAHPRPASVSSTGKVWAGAVPARSDRMVEILAVPASQYVEAFDRLSPGVVFG